MIGKDENSNDIQKLFAERIEAAQVQTQRTERLLKNDKPSYIAAVETVALRLKEVITPEPGSVGVDFYETLLFYEQYAPHDLSESSVSCLIQKAKTDFKAYQALMLFNNLIGANGQRFESLKEWQNNVYLGIFKPPKRPSGSSASKNVHRDTIIVAQIEALVGIGFVATRNRARQGQCACDVIVGALASLNREISYCAIESIWRRRGELPRPEVFANALNQVLFKSP